MAIYSKNMKDVMVVDISEDQKGSWCAYGGWGERKRKTSAIT